MATTYDARRGAPTEIVADTTKRGGYIQSFDLPHVKKNYPAVQPDFYGGNLVYVGPGAVQVGAGSVVSWPGGNIKTSTITNGFPGFTQGYVDGATGLVSTQFVTSSTAAFPVGIAADISRHAGLDGSGNWARRYETQLIDGLHFHH